METPGQSKTKGCSEANRELGLPVQVWELGLRMSLEGMEHREECHGESIRNT